MSTQGYTHALTLNTDRQLSLRRIEQIFSTFCHNMDRNMIGSQNVRIWPSSLRFNAIAFPEHLETNAHLHGMADLRPFQSQLTDDGIFEVVRTTWMKATRGSGSVFVEQLRDNGFASYAAKSTGGNDPTYFLAADFHPN